MAEGGGEHRTEAPTPRRLQRAREAGQLPISSELPICAGLAAAALTLALLEPLLLRRLTTAFLICMQHPEVSPLVAIHHLIREGVLVAAPLILLPAAASVLASGLQTNFAIHLGQLQPSMARLNPIAGAKRLLSPQNLIETLKAVAKLIAIGVIAWRLGLASLPWIAVLPVKDLHLLPPTLLSAIVRILLAVLAFQIFVSILDLLWTRFMFVQGLRMTPQDIKAEHRETEGDPLLKARLRRLRQQRAKQRMLAAVPKATVIVTNPTEYAVALSYDKAKPGAPRILAKGVDWMAARIREVAREHGIPLVANPPLARALYRIETDAEIPAEHYKAVAEIIAYVWRLRASAMPITAPPTS